MTDYFPSPNSDWRRCKPQEVGMNETALDAAFLYIQNSTKNGGLAVVKDGYLVYERYFGKGHPEAAPNLASCGKSFTSIAMGILMAEGSGGPAQNSRKGHRRDQRNTALIFRR